MNLIDRYVYDVLRRLKRSRRESVEKALKERIKSELSALGHAPSEDDIIAVLKRIGPPSEAAVYFGARKNGYAEPAYSGVFRSVFRIFFCLILTGILFFFLLGLSSSPSGWYVGIPDAFVEAVTALLCAFVIIIAVFGIIDHIFERRSQSAGGWEPRDLPPAYMVRIENTTDCILHMVGAAVGFVLFNFLLGRIGFVYPASGSFVHIFDSAQVSVFLPLWNAAWVVSFVYWLSLLIFGRPNLFTRIYSLFLPMISIGIIIYMLGFPSIISGELVAFVSSFFQSGAYIKPFFDTAYYVILALSIFGSAIELIKSSVSFSYRPPRIRI